MHHLKQVEFAAYDGIRRIENVTIFRRSPIARTTIDGFKRFSTVFSVHVHSACAITEPDLAVFAAALAHHHRHRQSPWRTSPHTGAADIACAGLDYTQYYFTDTAIAADRDWDPAIDSITAIFCVRPI
jgi:hypothetical protein